MKIEKGKVELPPYSGFAEGDEVSVMVVKKGVVVVVREEPKAAAQGGRGAGEAGGRMQSEGSAGPAPEEVALLRKLSAIKFERRIPFNVQKVLNDEEKKTLGRVLAKGYLRLYHEGRYKKTGVYNIDNRVYPLIAKKQGQIPAQEGGAGQKPKGEVAQAKSQAQQLTPLEALEKFGYSVSDKTNEARELSERLEKQIKSGQVMGDRGFDKRFYICTKKFYEANEKAVLAELGKGKRSAGQVAEALKMGEDAAAVMLQMLAKEGEAIEERRGVYSAV